MNRAGFPHSVSKPPRKVQVSGPEVRAAKKFLGSRGIKPNQISPRRFALAAKDLNKGFRSTLEYLGEKDDEGTGNSED